MDLRGRELVILQNDLDPAVTVSGRVGGSPIAPAAPPAKTPARMKRDMSGARADMERGRCAIEHLPSKFEAPTRSKLWDPARARNSPGTPRAATSEPREAGDLRDIGTVPKLRAFYIGREHFAARGAVVDVALVGLQLSATREPLSAKGLRRKGGRPLWRRRIRHSWGSTSARPL